MNTQQIIASIEGNIGSGKSTLLKYLQENNTEDLVCVDEPLNKWDKFCDSSGTTILQKFYEDPKKYAFSFQTMALLSRMTAIRDAIAAKPGKPIIPERSLYTDKLVFAQMLFESGHIEEVNYQIYLSWFDTFIVECPVDYIIYVKTDPHVCKERIHKRLREGEEGIPMDYLVNCDKYHESMIAELGKPTLILDGNVNIEDQPDLLICWSRQIKSFIGSL